jgi:hypothetical protein
MRFFALSIIRRALALYEIPSDIMGASAQGRNCVASSTLGCTQDVVPVGLPSAAICLRRKNSAEWQNALILPGQMNAHFWRAILAFTPDLKPVQLRHGAVQLTLE